MRLISCAVLLSAVLTPLAKGQAGYLDSNYISRVNVALGYNFVRGNAPPAVSNTFGTNGGFASIGIMLRPWLSAVGEVTGSHANQIGPLGQNLTLLTYTAGPRVTLHYARLTPFAQVTAGAGHASDSYFPRDSTYSTTATSFAYTLGGGLDLKLSRRLDLRPVELQYLHTAFPNGANDSQNHLVYGAGVVVKFGGQLWTPDPGRERHKAYKLMRSTGHASNRSEMPIYPAGD